MWRALYESNADATCLLSFDNEEEMWKEIETVLKYDEKMIRYFTPEADLVRSKTELYHRGGDEYSCFDVLTKEGGDVSDEIEYLCGYFSDNDWDEVDAITMMLNEGKYTLEDFKYNDDRYMWIKEFAEDHGLV